MRSGPSRLAEAIVAFLVPPACREEVLGDLCERYRSPLGYARDAIGAVPLVIFSRIRRTADPPMLLLLALTLHAGFMAWPSMRDGTLKYERLGLMRLAIPSAMVLLGYLLDVAYARPGRRSPLGLALGLARGPVIGCVLALLVESMLQSSWPEMALPILTTLMGCAGSLPFGLVIRMASALGTGRLQRASGPAFRLRKSMDSTGKKRWHAAPMKARRIIAFLCGTAVIFAGTLWMARAVGGGGPRVTYAQFLESVAHEQVDRLIVVDGGPGAVEATATLRDGIKERVVLPSDYDDALTVIENKLIDVEICRISRTRVFLTNAIPFFVILGFWILLIIRFRGTAGAPS